ncbi:MAG TPA: hypothetical protein VFP47_16730, partial [Pyrinomonadaceae bacterium]|nr:hypothetical protein [Pyrinomonadaceae bacterium]
FKLRRREPAGVGYLTPGYPLTPIIFLALTLLLLVLIGANNPTQALLGVVVVALGLPVYIFLFRHQRITRKIEEGKTIL